MSRARTPFKQIDLTRAARAMRAAGVEANYEIDPATGKIRIELTKFARDEQATDLDSWMKKHARTT